LKIAAAEETCNWMDKQFDDRGNYLQLHVSMLSAI